MSQRPVPVHVGSDTPARWDEIEELQRKAGGNAAQWLRDQRRPAVSAPDIDWDAHGLEPRWVGFDTADCAVALDPSIFHGRGADEFDRFRQSAASRGEVALVVSPIGGGGDDPRKLSIFRNDASVRLGRIESSVSGRRLGLGAEVQVAHEVDGADRQLALRLLSLDPPPRWYALTLDGLTISNAYGQQVAYPPQGTLIPILETALGEPVVAAWLSPDAVERRYIVPSEAPWKTLLSWLAGQALPEFVPEALQRARRHLATDPSLMTRRERDAREALAILETDYLVRKESLTAELDSAETAARSVREGLLYGTGSTLAEAVQAVLTSAGIDVSDIDEMLGDTKNADLLCTFEGRTLLVEVKSAAGNAPERAYEDLARHLREWPHLPGVPPIEGGALVINHQHRTLPHERAAQPYTRPEFLAAQSEPVVPTLGLFEAWREEDWESVRRLLFGKQTPERSTQRVLSKKEAAAPGGAGRMRRWFGLRNAIS